MISNKAYYLIISTERYKMTQVAPNFELKQRFETPDGKFFDTKEEAIAHIRRPLITTALLAIAGMTSEMADWILNNKEVVEVAFESGTVRRVTKAEGKKLDKAVEALKQIEGNKDLAFLIENAAAVRESFRWPSVKRMTDEEKVTLATNTIVAASDNADLAAWIIANKDAILAAYEAGVQKRQVNPAAADALAKYREQKAAEKAAKEAAAAKAAEGGDSTEAEQEEF